MDIYRRYFRVESGPLFDAVNSAREVNMEARISYKELLKEIGATEKYYQINNRLCAVTFENEPDYNLFKRVKRCEGGWYPKKNSKPAKAIAEKFKAVKTIDEQDCLGVVGLGGFGRIFANGKIYRETMVVIPSEPIVIFVSLPWYDIDPQKLAEFKGRKNSCDSNIEAILWEPTGDMAEIKHWQFERAIDEWNDSIK